MLRPLRLILEMLVDVMRGGDPDVDSAYTHSPLSPVPP